MGGEVSVRKMQPGDAGALSEMIASFRVELARFRGRERAPDLAAAREELSEYQRKGFPIYIAECEGRMAGYLILRVDEDVVWAESLYVKPEFRRRGVGSALYSKAEELCRKLGGDTVYNWVHPNNHAIISFLKKRGYTVLNLIELRRPWQGERPAEKIRMGEHEFDY